MILAFSPADIVQVPFGWLLSFLYDLTTNYGVALILFAVIVKLVLFPASAMSKKSTMRMSRLTPRIQEIQKKYANDQQKQSQAIQALYKEEGVSMGGGCLWSLLPLLVLIPLYTVVREPLQYMLGETADAAENILKQFHEVAPDLIKNVKDPYAQMIAAANISKYVEPLTEAGIKFSEKLAGGLNFSFFGIDLSAIPSWKVWTWDAADSIKEAFGTTWKFWTWDILKEKTFWKTLWAQAGGLIFPLLSVGSQVASMLISQKMNNSVVTNEKGVHDEKAAKEANKNSSTKTMMYIMPIMSLVIGFSMPAAMSLYWLAQGLIGTAIDVALTKHYRKIYDAEDASKFRAALEEEERQMEKERIRAERRAANPDGITQNTSKKKLQQNKQKEQEAAKAAAAKEYAEKKGISFEEAEKKAPLSGVESRPNCKGRAYRADRYSENTEE